MEALSEGIWDVVLSDTGLAQSLLALALSRSGKRVLHLDGNKYYGADEASLTLCEAKAWAVSHQTSNTFGNATIKSYDSQAGRLAHARSYNLALAPQIIYCQSKLLQSLVSSQVNSQLEFLAVGNWWYFDLDQSQSICRIPQTREDVVNDDAIDLRSKRSLMRFLRLAVDNDSHASILAEWGSTPFSDFLSKHCKLGRGLIQPVLALTLSPHPPAGTLTSFALPRIQKHLTSAGLFGSGFSAVIPKWGGLSEIAQVGCRALAVGGGVYVLGESASCPMTPGVGIRTQGHLSLELGSGCTVKTKRLITSHCAVSNAGESKVARCISVISDPLSCLFPVGGEGNAISAVALVVFPTGSVLIGEQANANGVPPITLMVHSAETGECPPGQCIVYSYMLYDRAIDPRPETYFQSMDTAMDKLLEHCEKQDDVKCEVAWKMQYMQNDTALLESDLGNNEVTSLPRTRASLVLEDDIVDHVEQAWRDIVGSDTADGQDEADVFMDFPPRQSAIDA